jgi:hypothetical protein
VKIAVVIPIWGREELAKRVILYYETLEVEGVEIVVFPVLSDERECAGITAPHLYAPNEPLGLKFNIGIDVANTMQFPCGVMIVGSDDLIAPAVFEAIREKDPLYQEIGGCHFFESATGRMIFAPHFNCGAGKYFSDDFLARCDGRPYVESENLNVDGGPRRFLSAGERLIMQSSADKPLCIDIKTAEENMWNFAWVDNIGGSKEITGSRITDAFRQMNGERPLWWRGL